MNYFVSKKLEPQKIKIKRNIKDVINIYRDNMIPMKVLLSDFLAVKSRGDILAEAINPWAYNYAGIEKNVIESGVSVDETAFRFGAMKLKEEKPTDVINAAFFANKKRNDSEFEIGYVLPKFIDIAKNKRVLVINPSPDIIIYLENNYYGEKYYVVTDITVAKLYSIEFPKSKFVSFENIDSLVDIDIALLLNRDQKVSECEKLINCLKVCNDRATLMALVPCVWFDNKTSGAYTFLSSIDFIPREMLIVSSEATVSSPRKKLLLMMEKGVEAESFNLYSSIYDKLRMEFIVERDKRKIINEKYFLTNSTIKSFWRNKDVVEKSASYDKAKEYRFSKEISIFYKVYANRKHSYAGVANYRQIIDVDKKLFGKVITHNIEKGLRAKDKEEVIHSLENVPFNALVYPIIKNDLFKNYVSRDKPLSLKTIWYYLSEDLLTIKEYNESLMRKLFRNHEISNYEPSTESVNELLTSISNNIGSEVEDIPFAIIKQFNMLFSMACKNGILKFNPIAMCIPRYTRRASVRQFEVRNALVKKHFSDEEEKIIFEEIVKKETKNGVAYLKCTVDSIWLAPAIRLFTGAAIKEVAALKWRDFIKVGEMDEYQLRISKFVDEKGTILLHSQRENWKRFRMVPVCNVLGYLLNARKEYLLSIGISEEYLQSSPIVLEKEQIKDMLMRKSINHCKPSRISAICNQLIKKVQIPENILILPDEKNELKTDINKLHGDIFLSNFRYKINQKAKMTMGEINYIIGIKAPDTFSKHYCDYTNEFIQLAMLRKIDRWAFRYYMIASKENYGIPNYGIEIGESNLRIGPFEKGVVSIDLITVTELKEDVTINISCKHGINYQIEEY